MKRYRDRFLKILYQDYKQAYYDTSITRQLDVVYSFVKGVSQNAIL